ncbi:DUF3231 family protein [Ureibacillus aquaedulcis]|uniref:DUF3231 family protein n=1 Tax=Ureibacillus aquaedulcis TaxID=3058421 RepID=A0ABT8GSQ1_9BACL|nr:DUF3231 family protein [Ureibacillus sp. BA0131]MDN4494389.1 DUF3231 family protein [Ureibacillus sp. BA0131]
MSEQQTMLTSSEIASIWTNYMNDSMSKCVLSYFLNHVEDEEIKSIIQFSYNLSATHIEKLTSIYNEEQMPMPSGFTENDVNINAPRMYTDTYMLTYINHMAKVGMLAFSGFTSLSARDDIRNYFIEGLNESSKLFERSSKVLLAKGLFVRAPYVAYPTKTDYVDSKKYLSGLNPFSNKRPLNMVEISYLYMNIQTNALGSKIAQSFAQASPVEKIQKWFLKGKEISQKHIQIFTKALLDNDIQPPVSPDVCITDSTISPFSDKLIMFHMALLVTAGIGNYATAAAASQRSDLILNYERLSLEIAQYAKDGSDILIENGWLEQPPGTKDKDLLTKKKNTVD